MSVDQHLLAELGVSVNRWVRLAAPMMARDWRRWRLVPMMPPVAPRRVSCPCLGGGMGGCRVVTVVVRPRCSRLRPKGQHRERQCRQKGRPESHWRVPLPCRGSPWATRANSPFNTAGASPGKSSLTSPGPKLSAQAAWIHTPAQAASKLSMP